MTENLTLDKKLSELRVNLAHAQNRLASAEEELELYQNLTDLDSSEFNKLLSDLLTGNLNKDLLDFNVFRGKFNVILGGDGKSQPWDENREGNVCVINTSYFIRHDFKNLLYQIVQQLHDEHTIDHFKIEYQKSPE